MARERDLDMRLPIDPSERIDGQMAHFAWRTSKRRWERIVFGRGFGCPDCLQCSENVPNPDGKLVPCQACLDAGRWKRGAPPLRTGSPQLPLPSVRIGCVECGSYLGTIAGELKLEDFLRRCPECEAKSPGTSPETLLKSRPIGASKWIRFCFDPDSFDPDQGSHGVHARVICPVSITEHHGSTLGAEPGRWLRHPDD